MYLCMVMTFYEKYPQLQDKGFLTEVLTKTVFATMALEDQQVPKAKVEEIILALLADEQLKTNQFYLNQSL